MENFINQYLTGEPCETGAYVTKMDRSFFENRNGIFEIIKILFNALALFLQKIKRISSHRLRFATNPTIRSRKHCCAELL